MLAAKSLTFLLMVVLMGGSAWPLIPTHARPRSLGRGFTACLTFGLIFLLTGAWLFPEFAIQRSLFVPLTFIGGGFLIGNILWARPLLNLNKDRSSWGDRLTWIFAGGAVTLIGTLTFLRPPLEWDARSIWFLHAKMLFMAQTVGPSAGWGLPELTFSHVDYPRLNALISSQLLSLFDFSPSGWNPLLAKGSLWILTILLSLASLTAPLRSSLARTSLFATLVLLGRERLWNGYMDVPAAGFCLLGFLSFLPAFSAEARRTPEASSILGQALQGLAFLTLATQLKNEATLMVGILGGLLILSQVRSTLGDHFRKESRVDQLRWIALTGITLAPWILWSWRKASWDLQNDLKLLSPEFLTRFTARSTHLPDLQMTLKALFLGPNLWIVLTPLAALSLWTQRKSHRGSAATILFAASFLYSIMIVGIYLGTYHDLRWHLGTSANRVMTFSVLANVVCCILFLDASKEDDSLGNQN